MISINPGIEEIKKLADLMAKECFMPEYQQPDNLEYRRQEGLGILIAKWAGWDGPRP